MRVVNCVPVVRTGSVTVMARDIGAALRLHGAEVRDMDYRPGQNVPESFPDLMKWLSRSGDRGLLVDINGAIVTSKPAQPYMAGRGNEFNSFTFLTDAPLHFPSRMEHWPLGGIVGLVDSSFREQARFMKYQRPDFISFPHAGPEVSESVHGDTERDIDILFIGNIAATEPVEKHAEKLYPGLPRSAALFINSFRNWEPMKTPFQIVLETALSMKDGYRRKDVALAAAHLERYLNNLARAETLSELTGLNVTLVGRVADGALSTNADVEALGFVPFDSCLKLMERAKIVINVRPGFPNGGHERVFYALSRGAAVMTTRSTFLETDRPAHAYIEYFDIESADIREKLVHVLENFNRGAMDREAMSRHYRQLHTWKQRLDPVLKHARTRSA